MKKETRKWVVFDDDPTGTQTVSGVDVILMPSRGAFRRFLSGSRQSVYVLTNTRAMPEEEAIKYLSMLKEIMDQEAERLGSLIGYILRGDSTLRGHVFSEMDVFRGDNTVGLFVPAFPECGRVTLGGIHYLVEGDHRIPTAYTEFAKDTVFGYKSETIAEWVAEKGNDWNSMLVPIARIRTEGASAITKALLVAEPGTVVIPDAETIDDVRVIVAGLADAEAAGKEIVTRGASTFAAARCGLEALELPGIPGGEEPGRLLVVCGSHTEASTRQLGQLTRSLGVEPVIVPTERLFAEGVAVLVPELAERLKQQIDANGIAVLASERVRESRHGDLKHGAKVMSALTKTLKAVAPCCDAVVSKGGITSAQIAYDGLQAEEAEVIGQLEAGISLWRLKTPKECRAWYAVIPGNVGDDNTIVRVVQKMNSSLFK
ncbi:four-carbon acid sugar kinase family protein [Paenibacillus sp. CF384]|uniref:four-carbon acid sugar kinase family protein n=1 Tax=Paenibacillus sp. CF384 TaxID=1884382 RepID=UPI0008971916|nr:four-carbon acid sugar kinase family protein [Paenibacillus sp. CF384]SDW48146.1 Uncharacterized conserved protein YgbK, DUF1537 family [Paenibacillus sp. CF384]